MEGSHNWFLGATWAATEVAPMGGNPVGGLTVIGLGFGLGGWAAGGDAPTLSWAGGGIVFEFGNSPCSWGAKGRVVGRTIIYEGTPDATLRNHELQHVKQYAALGDIGYLGGHLLSMGLSCLISGDYASANLLEAGPYGAQGAFGGEQRPWAWQGGAKEDPPSDLTKCNINKYPLKARWNGRPQTVDDFTPPTALAPQFVGLLGYPRVAPIGLRRFLSHGRAPVPV